MIADSTVPVGVSLSGGLDSSIVAAFARDVKEELNTFVVGVSGSTDLAMSKDVAKFLGTSHYHYEYTFNEMIEALPAVIYHLESFDAALIRSAIPNYFLAKLASDHVKVILTGEGADELYAGYEYLDPIDNPTTLQKELVTITGKLHNTNLQRADRMSMAYGLEARVPFLDKEFVDFSLSLPAEWKIRHKGWAEKELLRKASKGLVPEKILKRPKKKFSDGAGSMDLLAEYANHRISDNEFLSHQNLITEAGLRSKEELFYFLIFQSFFGNRIPPSIVGRTRSITSEELQ
jgi:asparagine synthase (glutamine-hydrolysing)